MSTTKNRSNIRKMVFSGIFLALCLLLPSLTGRIPVIGTMLSPMHFPVLLCGFVCGWPWGLAVGFIAPLLSSLIFTMPPMFPVAVSMAFELAAYGALTGLLYRVFPKKIPYLYLALVLAMLGGRLVGGLVSIPLYLAGGNTFTMAAFLDGYFVLALPGIIVQIVLIPPIVLALRKAKLME